MDEVELAFSYRERHRADPPAYRALVGLGSTFSREQPGSDRERLVREYFPESVGDKTRALVVLRNMLVNPAFDPRVPWMTYA